MARGCRGSPLPPTPPPCAREERRVWPASLPRARGRGASSADTPNTEVAPQTSSSRSCSSHLPCSSHLLKEQAMVDRATDPRYLAYQYGDSEKLRIRLEAHERYSEHPQ